MVDGARLPLKCGSGTQRRTLCYHVHDRLVLTELNAVKCNNVIFTRCVWKL